MSRNTLRRPAVAALAAILTVVVVSAGSATAAKMITGKDIKNGSITSKDLKDKSVKKADLAADATAALTGPAGPAGPAGQAGQAGAAGPAGPAVLTNVFTTAVDVELLAANTEKVVASKILPSGKPYLFTAKLSLYATTAGAHSCTLMAGPDVLDTALVNTTAAMINTPVALTGVTPSAGLARVSCTVSGGLGSAKDIKVVAVPVAAIG